METLIQPSEMAVIRLLILKAIVLRKKFNMWMNIKKIQEMVENVDRIMTRLWICTLYPCLDFIFLVRIMTIKKINNKNKNN